MLGKAFTWTCGMFVPPRETANAVRFLRNNVPCAIVGHSNGICSYEIPNTRYTYGCSSTSSYTLTIPAENMTEYEQGSMWMCQYFIYSSFRSLVVTLHLSGTYHLKRYNHCFFIFSLYKVCPDQNISFFLHCPLTDILYVSLT